MAPPCDSSTTARSKSNDGSTKPPSITSVARDGFICIKVGPLLKETYVHKSLLTHHSEYFRTALKAPWKEAEDRTVTLTDVKPVIFDLFVAWLYTGTLPQYRCDLDILEGETGEEADSSSDDRLVSAMVMAYAFGDRFLAFSYQRAALDNLIRYVNDVRVPTWFHATVFAFQNLSEESPILQALVDIHCRYWDADQYDELDDTTREMSELVPTTFWIRTTNKFATKDESDEWWTKPLDACDYHEHVTDEEREQCSKKKK